MLSLLRTLPNLTKTFVRTLIQWENYIDCVNYPTQTGLFKGISNRFAKCIFSSASSTHASLNEKIFITCFFAIFMHSLRCVFEITMKVLFLHTLYAQALKTQKHVLITLFPWFSCVRTSVILKKTINYHFILMKSG